MSGKNCRSGYNPTNQEEQKIKTGDVSHATYSLFSPKHLYGLSGLAPWVTVTGLSEIRTIPLHV